MLCFFVFILALQSKLYTWVGKMIAVCVIHGGVGPHFFSERLFQQICGVETTPATVDEVGDHTFRQQLMKVSRRKVLYIECTVYCDTALQLLSINFLFMKRFLS